MGILGIPCSRIGFASYDTRVVNTNADYLTMTVNEEIIRQSYLEAGRPDAFNPDDVRFLSDWQFGYTMGCAGIIAREKPAANFLIGYFYAESLILAESGALVGAIQVAATSSNVAQLPFFVAACDYTMIGEEFCRAAALSKEPVIYGSVLPRRRPCSLYNHHHSWCASKHSRQ